MITLFGGFAHLEIWIQTIGFKKYKHFCDYSILIQILNILEYFKYSKSIIYILYIYAYSYKCL